MVLSIVCMIVASITQAVISLRFTAVGGGGSSAVAPGSSFGMAMNFPHHLAAPQQSHP